MPNIIFRVTFALRVNRSEGRVFRNWGDEWFRFFLINTSALFLMRLRMLVFVQHTVNLQRIPV